MEVTKEVLSKKLNLATDAIKAYIKGTGFKNGNGRTLFNDELLNYANNKVKKVSKEYPESSELIKEILIEEVETVNIINPNRANRKRNLNL
jgi:hypothetical protein